MSNLPFRDPLCERAREYVSLALDGELSELENALLRAHLSRCRPCRAFELEIGRVTHELRAAPAALPTSPITVPRRRHASVRVLQVGAAAAVLAVAVFAGAMQALVRPEAATVASSRFVVDPGTEVRDLRVFSRSQLEPGLRASPALLRGLRLPGDS